MIQLGLMIARHQPNQAHSILAKWERVFDNRGGKVIIVTQNIDGYHRVAGSQNVYEFHGSFGTLYCTNCSWRESFQIDITLVERLENMQESLPPRCPECDAVIRPNVVLFEETLPWNELEEFQHEFNSGHGFDLVFSVGTSAMFPYISGPFFTAVSLGIPTIDINPVESELSQAAHIHLPLPAEEAIMEIDKRLAQRQG